MNKYAIIGNPLGHTMSPFIHGRLFELAGHSAEYECIEIIPEDLPLMAYEINSLSGYNVTIPHKVAIIDYVDSLDETAERYNSINCVANTPKGVIGYNTDCYGFLRAVEDFPLSGNILILGCGGVGRMIAIECALHGADITIAIIESARSTALKLLEEINSVAPYCNVRIIDMNDISGYYSVLINATPVGMYPKSDVCPVSDEVISNCLYVYDVVYNPVRTLLVQKALNMGKTALGGMSMLVYQAVKAHEIWDGDLYTPQQINQIIEECNAIVERDFR